MKNLITISAPSGAGKTTLCRSIQAQVPQIKWSVSYTTRKKRKIEKNGVDYQFISESTFKKLIDNSFFAEWEKVHGFYYGTSKDSINNIIKKDEMLLSEFRNEFKLSNFSITSNSVKFIGFDFLSRFKIVSLIL